MKHKRLLKKCQIKHGHYREDKLYLKFNLLLIYRYFVTSIIYRILIYGRKRKIRKMDLSMNQ